MQFLFLSLFSAGIVVLDQWSKYLTVTNIKEYQHVAFLPGVMSLTFVKNEGAAWSLLSGMQWLFVTIFAVLTVLLILEYFVKPMPFTKLERWFIAAIYGGGLGNVIDRVRLGYVVDMFETDFIRFPVFNVADIFITCGCFLLLIHLIFFNKAFWKDDKHDTLG